ncbi:hypothetical protein L6164_033204 [Bauhinia variegata]|uniref:Uncharacterized protein n=1 Tax=Bauhinia variegata TaxID=167791 RepID=A0ACB9KR63_BAUVA|nr:hypothetical protein L6164_033204 [Bauhinia variegata]
MKTVFFALFLLFAFNRKLPSATAQVVVDTNGDYVRNGGRYYLLPAFRGHGGGLRFAKLGNETCPLSVVQDPNEFSH